MRAKPVYISAKRYEPDTTQHELSGAGVDNQDLCCSRVKNVKEKYFPGSFM